MTAIKITLTETDRPSRSKMAGPCWIEALGVYASSAPRELDATIGQRIVLTGKVNLRRATRTTVDRNEWTVVATGRATDTVTVRLGSPQAVVATLTGVVAEEDWTPELEAELAQPAATAAEETTTAAEMARLHGVSLSTIYRRIKAGILAAVKIGRRWLITAPVAA